MIRTMLGVATAAVLCAVGHASTVQVTTRAGLGTENDFVSWNAIIVQNGNNTNLTNPTTISTSEFLTNGGVGFGLNQQPHVGGAFNPMFLSHCCSLDGGDTTQADLHGETSPGNTNPIDLKFASPFQALGFDIAPTAGGGSGFTGTVNVFGGNHVLLGVLSVGSPNANPIFLGVSSNNPTADINEILFNATTTQTFAIDRISLIAGQAAAVPEPGTFGLLLLGAAAATFGYLRKRAG